MNTLLNASSLIFPIVTFPYVSRVLGAEGTGVVSFAVSVTAYFLMFSSLGIPSYGIRACARVRDDREKLSTTASELLVLNGITSAVSLGAFSVLLYFSKTPALFAVCGLAIVLETVGALWLFRALEQYSYITLCSLACKGLSLLGLFVFVKSGDDTLPYALMTVIASYGVNIFALLRLKKYIIFKRISLRNVCRHIKPILVFFATTVAISVYTNLDTVMLGLMKDARDVGIYTAAVKIKSVLTTLATSLGAVMLPRLTALLESGDKNGFSALISKTARLVFSLALPLTVFFVLFSEETVSVLSGADFINASLPSAILTLTVVIVALSNVTGILILVPQGRERAVMVSVFAGALTDFVLNLILIPERTYVGAALSTLTAEIVVLAVQLVYLKKDAPKLFYLRPAVAVIFAAVVTLLFTPDLIPFLRIVVGFVIFAVAYSAVAFIKIKSRG